MGKSSKPRPATSAGAGLTTPPELQYAFAATFGGNPLEVQQRQALEAARKPFAEISQSADDDAKTAMLVYSYASLRLLPGYSTLNHEHAWRIREVVETVTKYTQDESLVRPLNFLLVAPPGAGKSQLVKSIVNKLVGSPVGLVSFNMATMESKDELVRVLDAARNLVVDGKLPLVFLDEFDSSEKHYPLLLPLLWDGELGVAHRDLRIGRSVFFLAGSRPSLLGRLEQARSIFTAEGGGPAEDHDDKLVDVFSRMNGKVVQVPSLKGVSAVADKVTIAMHLLRRRFRACEFVPRALLSFIAEAEFRYEARSLATLIDMIQADDAQQLQRLRKRHLKSLPLRDKEALKLSPLAFHLVNDDGAGGLVSLWNKADKIEDELKIRDDVLDKDTSWPDLPWRYLTKPSDVLPKAQRSPA